MHMDMECTLYNMFMYIYACNTIIYMYVHVRVYAVVLMYFL